MKKWESLQTATKSDTWNYTKIWKNPFFKHYVIQDQLKKSTFEIRRLIQICYEKYIIYRLGTNYIQTTDCKTTSGMDDRYMIW